jgi:hypothetical protein
VLNIRLEAEAICGSTKMMWLWLLSTASNNNANSQLQNKNLMRGDMVFHSWDIVNQYAANNPQFNTEWLT